MEERYSHNPVLTREVIDFLKPLPGKIIIDATIGSGAHAEEILKKITPDGLLIGIDTDIESLNIASERIRPFEGSFKLINKNFRYMKNILNDIGVKKVDGIIFDLGISSIQMETRERGFSIKYDGPLDMRMDRNQRLLAKDLVNNLREEELSLLIRDFGEERFYRRIARNIVSARQRLEISTTHQLAEIVSSSIPRRYAWKIHPATRTFQAFRIKVNDELESLKEALSQSEHILNKEGRICVISFHSLEDRIVKNFFKVMRNKNTFKILTKKPVMAKEDEVSLNPRSRSAKLRAIEKI